MKWYFFLSALSFMISCTPKNTSKWSMQRISKYEEGIKCTLGTKYSVKQRRNMFPFNKAKKVLFIAFRNRGYFSMSSFNFELMDTTIDVEGKLIILPKFEENGCEQKEIIKKWDYSDIDTSQKFYIFPRYCTIESVELNSNQVDTLSNFLFNYRLNKIPLTTWHSACYSPRNAILFLNEKNQIVSLIEICFECWEMKFSFDKNTLRICDCGKRLSAFKSLFASAGIKYGIETRH
jgi:hypothetical protein